MKIQSITKVGKTPVYDISVDSAEHYVLENGVVTHNTGVMYSSNTVWIIGRSQEKDGTEITGWNFNINVEKSRFVKEKSKLSFLVTYEGGINRWSGLMDLALESGHCVKPKNGWYAYKGSEKTCRFADTNNKEFWLPILTDKDFQKFVKDKYQLGAVSFTQLDEEE
jgi:hypothetical protein